VGLYAVTAAVFESIRADIAACCVLSRSAGASIHLVDVGIGVPMHESSSDPTTAPHRSSKQDAVSKAPSERPKCDRQLPMPEPRTVEVGARPDIIVERGRIRAGTRDMVTESAMHAWELEAALRSGAEAAAKAVEDGVKVVCVGEIGIGNTTAAAALLSALTGAILNTLAVQSKRLKFHLQSRKAKTRQDPK
jgi:NaMN:DMB phosphoribosyltransferase